MKPCKDCEPGSKRPAPHPGPRCATHHRARRRAVSAQAHGRRLVRQFRITPELYAALYAAQGGRCYVCQRSNGTVKRLAVEHDHYLAAIESHPHPVEQGCPRCITGLACGPCNQDVLGRLGRDPATYERIAATLRNPPARAVFTALSTSVED